jgi:sporulation protein YlmC with PRC-barrel domain
MKESLMKLRLGQPVHTTDGHFGEVGDIVIDPVERVVTHLVVEPHHRHYQARLVPIRLVSIDGDDVKVAIDSDHLRSLQRVADSEFVRLDQTIDLGPDWDLGTEDVTSVPNTGVIYEMVNFEDGVTVSYDRIPRGECEIRSSSMVSTADGHDGGTVEGFIADGTHLVGVVVRTRRRGLRHYAVVPMSAVAKVRTDLIVLNLDKAALDQVPASDGVMGSADAPSTLARLEHRASKTVGALVTKLTALLRRRPTSRSDNVATMIPSARPAAEQGNETS